MTTPENDLPGGNVCNGLVVDFGRRLAILSGGSLPNASDRFTEAR